MNVERRDTERKGTERREVTIADGAEIEWS